MFVTGDFQRSWSLEIGVQEIITAYIYLFVGLTTLALLYIYYVDLERLSCRRVCVAVVFSYYTVTNPVFVLP